MRRRRSAMPRTCFAAALAGALALSGCAQVRPVTSPAPAGSATATATPSADLACAQLAATMTPAEQAGQVLLVGIATAPDQATVAMLSDRHVGGVLLTEPFHTGVAGVRALTEPLLAAEPTLLVAARQEGGARQTLSGTGFDTIPAAAEQAASSGAELRAAWAGWGEQLAQAGVRLNLVAAAEVAAGASGPAAGSYGSDPEQVAQAVSAVVAGQQDAGLAVAVGPVPGTDSATGEPAADRTRTVDDLAGDRVARAAAAADGLIVPAVTFTRIDEAEPALYSATVIGALRDGLGFSGVILSDDLAGETGVEVGQRAVRFVRAGGSLAVTSDATLVPALTEGLVAAAGTDSAVKVRLQESAAEVLRLKSGLGLVECADALG